MFHVNRDMFHFSFVVQGGTREVKLHIIAHILSSLLSCFYIIVKDSRSINFDLCDIQAKLPLLYMF